MLRVATREGKKTHKRTLANLSHWPPEQVETLRRVLRGERLVAPESLFAIQRSLPHGHTQAVLTTMRRRGRASPSSLSASRATRRPCLHHSATFSPTSNDPGLGWPAFSVRLGVGSATWWRQ